MQVKNSPIDFTSMLTGGLDSALSAGFGWLGSGLQMRNNKRLQKYAAELQYDTWSKMTENTRNWNEYLEKMSKMSEAGLNPLYSEANAPQSAVSAGLPSASADMPFSSSPFNLGDSVANALKNRELTLREREVAVQEKLGDKQGKKLEAETDQLIQITPHTIDAAAEQARKLKLEGDQLDKVLAQMDAQLEIKQEEAHASMINALAHALEASVAESANEWNEDVSRQNAATNAFNAQTSYYNFELARDRAQAELKKMGFEMTDQYNKTLRELQNKGIEFVEKLRNLYSFDAGPLSVRLPLSWMADSQADRQAIISYMNSEHLTPAAKLSCREALNAIEDAQINIKSIGLPKDAKRPKFKLQSGFNMPWTSNDGSY